MESKRTTRKPIFSLFDISDKCLFFVGQPAEVMLNFLESVQFPDIVKINLEYHNTVRPDRVITAFGPSENERLLM